MIRNLNKPNKNLFVRIFAENLVNWSNTISSQSMTGYSLFFLLVCVIDEPS